MATRFYLPAEGSGTPSVSPAFDGGWEQTGQANRLKLLPKTTLVARTTLAATSNKTVPISVTQDVLCDQFVSDPIPAQRIIGTVSLVVGAAESAAAANASLSIVLRVVSQDGGTFRGTLFSVFSTDTEFATSISTRIVNAQAVTALTTAPGDRLVLDIGAHIVTPLSAQTYTMTFGTSNASDYALTSALTTTLNPWLELSQNIWDAPFNSYKSVDSVGLSVTEKIR
jgi:hypothetical protein